MAYTIAQIGKNRLERVLNSTREQDIKKLLNLLKSDIKTVLESYAIVSGDVEIEIDEEQSEIVITMQSKLERFKTFGTIIR